LKLEKRGKTGIVVQMKYIYIHIYMRGIIHKHI